MVKIIYRYIGKLSVKAPSGGMFNKLSNPVLVILIRPGAANAGPAYLPILLPYLMYLNYLTYRTYLSYLPILLTYLTNLSYLPILLTYIP
jgi:hypothetical protein